MGDVIPKEYEKQASEQCPLRSYQYAKSNWDFHVPMTTTET